MKTTINMARESWVDVYGLGHDRAKFIEALKHFECLARADEREALIEITQALLRDDPFDYTALAIQLAIRARSCPPCNEDCDQGRSCPARKSA